MPDKIWTEDKINELRCLASEMTVEELAKHYELSKNTIQAYLSRYGIYAKQDKDPVFTQEEIEKIKELSKTQPVQQIAAKYNMYTTDMAELLKKYDISYLLAPIKWKGENLARLRVLVKTKTIREIAIEFDTTFLAIHSTLRRYHISHKKAGRSWSIEEIEDIRNLAQNCSIGEISSLYGTDYSTIKRLMEKNNIDRPPIRTFYNWTDEEIKKLRTLAKNMTIKELAAHYKRSYDYINHLLSQYGIQSKGAHHEIIIQKEDIESIKKTIMCSSARKIKEKLTEMANKYNITYEYLKKLLKKMRVFTGSLTLSQEKLDFIRSQAREKTIQEFAESFEMPYNSMYVLLKRHNIQTKPDVSGPRTTNTIGDIEKLQLLREKLITLLKYQESKNESEEVQEDKPFVIVPKGE